MYMNKDKDLRDSKNRKKFFLRLYLKLKKTKKRVTKLIRNKKTIEK